MPMMGASRCLAMHAVMSNAPICRPRVRKLCTHATASCAGSALLNIDWSTRSVASSLDSEDPRNMMVLTQSDLATWRASYPSCAQRVSDRHDRTHKRTRNTFIRLKLSATHLCSMPSVTSFV